MCLQQLCSDSHCVFAAIMQSWPLCVCSNHAVTATVCSAVVVTSTVCVQWLRGDGHIVCVCSKYAVTATVYVQQSCSVSRCVCMQQS